MKGDDCIKKALEEVKMDNYVEARDILEQAARAGETDAPYRLLEDIRKSISHLESKEAYKDFYEQTYRKQREDSGSSLSLKFRTWIGRKTKKIIQTSTENARYDQLEKDIRSGGFKRVCDIGCYNGTFSIPLGARNPGLTVVGVDVSELVVKEARKFNRYDNVSFRVGFAEEVDRLFEPESFDCVLLFEILEHVIDVDEVIESALRILAPGGLMAITVPHGFNSDEPLHERKEHVRAFKEETIRRQFGQRKDFSWKKIHLKADDPKYSPDRYWSYITFRR